MHPQRKLFLEVELACWRKWRREEYTYRRAIHFEGAPGSVNDEALEMMSHKIRQLEEALAELHPQDG